MKPTILFVILLILASCSAEKRLARLVERHPELVQRDTIFKSDTTITERITADTTLIFQHTTDTFFVTKDRLKIQLIHDHDTIRVNADVKPDTIVKTITVQTNSVSPVIVKNKNGWLWALLVSLILIIVWLAAKRNK